MYRTITAKLLPWLLRKLNPGGGTLLKKLKPAGWLLLLLLTLAGSWLGLQRLSLRWQEETARSATLLYSLRTAELQRDSLAAQNELLVLSRAQATALLPALEADIRRLGVRLSRVQQYTAAGMSVQQQLQLPLRDTVIYDSVRYDTVAVRVFRYADDYLQLWGMATDSLQRLDFSYRDTLIQVVYRGERRRPWLWILSRRRLEQRLRLKNGRAELDYAQTIKIEKR